MKILHLQTNGNIRTWKQANAMRAVGHRVSLGYVKHPCHVNLPGLDEGIWDRCEILDIAHPRKWIKAYCEGCDVLIHEVYSFKGFKTRPARWQKYHIASHCSTKEVGELAARVKPDLLILYHLLLWGSTPEELVQEVRRYFDGKVVCGEDLGIY